MKHKEFGKNYSITITRGSNRGLLYKSFDSLGIDVKDSSPSIKKIIIGVWGIYLTITIFTWRGYNEISTDSGGTAS